MDRKALREFTHKADQFLDLKNADYKQWVFRYTFLELEKDLGDLGDITSAALFPANKPVKAAVFAKEPGVIAGLEEVKYFLVDSDANFRPRLKGKFSLNLLKKDGEAVEPGEKILEIEAGAADLLSVERVALNLLMRMSGVATFTSKVVKIVKDKDLLLVPTRKTLWGWLDKKAVVLGGGGTHRLGLADSVIVKDTHLDAFTGGFEEVLDTLKDLDCRFVEIEVNDKERALSAAKAISSTKLRAVPVLMLDNFSVSEAKNTISELHQNGLNSMLFEVSGGINESNLLQYADCGADIISMGVLTGGVKSLDLSMKILK